MSLPGSVIGAERWTEAGQRSMFCSMFQVSRNGMVNSVFTLYELSNGDDTEGEGMRPVIKRYGSSFFCKGAAHMITSSRCLTSAAICFSRVPWFRRVDAAALTAGATNRRQSRDHHHGWWEGGQVLLKRCWNHTHIVWEPSYCTLQANVKSWPPKATQGAPRRPEDAGPAAVVAFWFAPVQSLFLLEET